MGTCQLAQVLAAERVDVQVLERVEGEARRQFNAGTFFVSMECRRRHVLRDAYFLTFFLREHTGVVDVVHR
ncbi:hypothetical protein D3C87_1309640 [compost metagenome]